MRLKLQLMRSHLLFAMNVHSLFVNPVMSMKGGKAFKLVLSAKLGSPRVEGDEEEDDFDDLDHEFDYNSSVRRYPHHVVEAALAARLNVGYGVNGSGIMTPSEARVLVGFVE
nr:cellulose synthase A catalytic subunit 2 [UDP-forming]-like [Ipomoea batatas]